MSIKKIVFIICSMLFLYQPTANAVLTGYVLKSSLWKVPIVKVCWENPSEEYSVEQSWVIDSLNKTWQAHSQIQFVGWQICPENFSGVRVLISDEAPHTKELGRYLTNVEHGVVLNFSFENWSTLCQASEIAREECIRAITVHEFGHVLGFAHEQNRPDPPEDLACPQAPIGQNGDLTVGEWDIHSVMNYCNPKFNNDGVLSETDIVTVQEFYGKNNLGMNPEEVLLPTGENLSEVTSETPSKDPSKNNTSNTQVSSGACSLISPSVVYISYLNFRIGIILLTSLVLVSIFLKARFRRLGFFLTLASVFFLSHCTPDAKQSELHHVLSDDVNLEGHHESIQVQSESNQCGDGIVQVGEECDNDSPACRPNCTAVCEYGLIENCGRFIEMVHEIYSSSYVWPHLMTLDLEENILLGGQFEASFVFEEQMFQSQSGFHDAFITKLTSAPSLEWMNVWGSDLPDAIDFGGIDTDGNILVAGDFMGPIEIGEFSVTPDGMDNLFVAKISSSGQVKKLHNLSGKFSYGFMGVAGGFDLDRQGDLFLGVRFHQSTFVRDQEIISQGKYDGLVIKYNKHLLPQWYYQIGGADEDVIHALTIDSMGHLWVVASIKAPAVIEGQVYGSESSSVLIVKFSPQGEVLLVKDFPVKIEKKGNSFPMNPISSVIARSDQQGKVTIAFDIQGTLKLDASVKIEDKGTGLFLLQLNQNAEVNWARKWGLQVRDMQIDHQGDFVLTGYFNEAIDFAEKEYMNKNIITPFLAKLDSEGREIWLRPLDESGQLYVGQKLAIYQDNSILLSLVSSLGYLESDHIYLGRFAP